MDSKTKAFLISYPYRGGRWSVEIQAVDHADAIQRLKALGSFGKVDGEMVARVPAFVPVPWLFRMWQLITGR